MKLCVFVFVTLTVALGLATGARSDVLLLDDPLQGSTSGTFNGGSGQFVTGGWKITNKADAIYWHLPHTVYRGAVEFSVTGLNPNECRPGLTDKSELFHMYDWTYGSADTSYGGYRDNKFKHFIRKNGCVSSYNNTIDKCELVLVIAPNYQEPDSITLGWDPAVTYTFREEWGPDGNGNCAFRTYRDGVLIQTMVEPGSWSPHGHSVRIGRARMDEWSGAPLDAVFSNVKVWDTESSIPSTPVVTAPGVGRTVNTRTPLIQWAWTPTFNRYQVRITTANSPSAGYVWDSGTVMSVRNYATTATLNNLTNYYVWVKLGNVIGWTDWSAAGQWFRVDTSYTVPNPGMTRVVGNSLQDNNGPLLALGFTYMEGLGFCKNDRDRFRSDVAFMASRGFNYMRILSEVPGADDWDYWYGRSINASNYTCPHGTAAYAWPDYDQQFRDMLDIAYDEYGMRAEVTIFGGAGDSFPDYPGRQAHCQRILNLIAGREHKVMFLEVANEGWQTGFDYPQGITDMRSLCQYLADRTSVPAAISATPWGNYPDPNQTMVELYNGSAADIATEHFERDIHSFEGGWLPVRDCWRIENATGVPPCSSDEPIGPGSSVNTELDPIKLVSAASFAWIAKLPAYVYHTSAGVRGDYRFEDFAGVNDYRFLAGVIPPDMPNWTRNDGKEASAPFTAYCNGQPNKYWTDFGTQNLPNGCHRNIGGVKGRQFVCYPQGVLAGGLTLTARREMSYTVYNPLTGQVPPPGVVNPASTGTLTAGQSLVLSQGSGAFIIKGMFPADSTRPGSVLKFVANPGDGRNSLTWQNPPDSDFSGTKVVFRTDRCPTSIADGTPVCDKLGQAGARDQYEHTGLTNGQYYYYAAFAYDDSSNYSTPSTAMGIPVAGQCFFDRFTYPDGNLTGNRSWTGSATSSEVVILSDAVKITGGTDNKEAVYPVSCSGSGGIIDAYATVKMGSGSQTLWGLWFDDASGRNLARWYGRGTTARPRIGDTGTVLPEANLTGGWDILRVRINTAANTSEFFFNGASLGTLSHVETAAGDSIGRVMLERIYNSTTGDIVYLDNVVIGPAPPDVTPPGPVTGFIANNQESQVSLSWVNPTDVDFAGARIVRKGSGYPSDPSDGTVVYDGAGTGCVDASPLGGTSYYAAYAYDWATNFSVAVTASVVRAGLVCQSDTFTYANGNLNGNGGWIGSATTQVAVENQSVKLSGGAGLCDSSLFLSCDSLSGNQVAVSAKINRGSGTSIFWNLWIDDPSGNNFGYWFGTGLLARGRTGAQQTASKTLTGAWDYLYVKIDFAANTTQYFFNGVSIGSYSHAGTAAGDAIGRIRFERLDLGGASGQYVYFDDLKIGDPDTLGPAPSVSAPSAAITRTCPVSYTVTFDEPVIGFNSSSDIQVNATGSAAAGSVAVTGSGPYTVTLSSITGAGTLGITVKAGSCFDAAGNPCGASSPSATCKVIASDGSISAARALADGTQTDLGDKVLYLKWPGFAYVAEQNRSSGVRLQGSLSGSEGDLVCLSGTAQTTLGGEKYIQVTAMSPCGTYSLNPLGCNNRGLTWPLMEGLYVRTWSKVKPGSVGPDYFTITDGSDDAGIKVITNGAPGVSDGEFANVSGAAGYDGARVIYRK